MKSIIIIILAFTLGIGTFFLTQKKESTTTVTPPIIKNTQAPESVMTQEITPSTPQRIVISKLGIDAPIESVGLDSEKKMDVPKDPDSAGWYNLGYKPGDKGSAVLAGHVDTPTGAPAIFYNLSKLTSGDEIEITDEKNTKHIFTVTKSTTYPFDKVPLNEVFASNDMARLNLITCDGSFDKANKNYTMRRVVYAVQKE